MVCWKNLENLRLRTKTTKNMKMKTGKPFLLPSFSVKQFANTLHIVPLKGM